MPTIIKPTIGRVVLFHPANAHPNESPRAAIVTEVWGDRCVNLAIFEQNGVPMSHPPTSVQLVQDGDPKPTAGFWCEWMPYQIGQAAKEAAPAPIAAEVCYPDPRPPHPVTPTNI